jgi:hypothetical protein
MNHNKKPRNIPRNEKINPGILDKKRLLDELANDIAIKFWLDKEKTKKLLESDISRWLKELKNEISLSDDENLKSLKNKKVEELFFTLKWASEIIEKLSKIEIKTLKEELEKTISIEDFKNHIEAYLPPKLIKKAKNPRVLHEHVLGFALWTANSIFTTTEILYKIWKWLLQTPYHIYMIITGKWKYEGFKDI